MYKRQILHVARRSPIIRFDAAMTLTKKHYQRLWFPEPGSGGDIPSRAEHGMTRGELDAAMPVEFWREVVDRVARDAPDTLLLAEAFWLLEGYFVRSLGMHRVYNSAFMNMLRDEKNAEYRQLIKSTLEFDPQILKRYVNFMSNPDERTAVDQFGRDDKYFGVATLMVTLPGLPMFGHGQVEGFAEKYGMEFRRARWREEPDRWLIERHRRQLFGLMHRRRLHDHLGGRGVPGVRHALVELEHAPVRRPLADLVARERLERLLAGRGRAASLDATAVAGVLHDEIRELLETGHRHRAAEPEQDASLAAETARVELDAMLALLGATPLEPRAEPASGFTPDLPARIACDPGLSLIHI